MREGRGVPGVADGGVVVTDGPACPPHSSGVGVLALQVGQVV